MKSKILSILNIVVLCLIVFVVSIYFVENAQLIGFVLVGLSILCVATLKPLETFLMMFSLLISEPLAEAKLLEKNVQKTKPQRANKG